MLLNVEGIKFRFDICCSLKEMAVAVVTVTGCRGWRPTDLQSAVEEAAVLPRLVAQAFAGCDRGHGSGGHQRLRPTCRSAAGCKVVPLPRHHDLDAPVTTARWGRGTRRQTERRALCHSHERTRENERKAEEDEGQGGRGRRQQPLTETPDGDLAPMQPPPRHGRGFT